MRSITPQDAAIIEVAGGVDTHSDTHTAAVIDQVGRVLGTEQFPADTAGYAALLDWMRSFGQLVGVGVEGTGAYGAGLARLLHRQEVLVIEVDRPDRKTRRFQGKSDPIDAVQAAKTALAGERTGVPKQRDGRIEALRNLRVARRSAVDQRADAQRRIKTLIVTAPDDLRERLRSLGVKDLITTCANLRPDRTGAASPATAVKIALRSPARRHQQLTAEIADLDELLEPLVAAINPGLVAANGVGTDVAGQLLVTTGDNHDRLRSEAAFAMLCGAAPIPASSGKTNRHRLNRGGDRQANKALYRVVICRLRWDPRTRAYMERRTKDGLSKKEIIRCLKRYVARELYQLITTPNDLELAA
ncbi:transposase [Actinomadura hallensis]|uniref:Transposase n=1 Tax=Actinomadura hallensis TaxID=337895 RepID=A0A543IFD1_9ACTN|nr:IS110 family transposase [Actinomadura hallensis]TQM69277.1 transposase [Actinomadura hallensis]